MTTSVTAAERIRDAVSQDIVSGFYLPGVALDEATIAARFSVSRTPVREALRHLAATGFVELRPRRGAVVAHFTPDKLTEMFVVMAEMEVVCARFAAEAVDPEGATRLQAAHRTCLKAADSGEVDWYAEANLAFHETIYELSGNAFLKETTLGVRKRLAPFRKAQFRSLGRLKRSVEEHARIVEAIVEADPDRAAAQMRNHVQVVREALGAVAPALGDARAQVAARLAQ
jgi:DNA-binding GntR family transcriptional regulator